MPVHFRHQIHGIIRGRLVPACYALENCERGLKISRWNSLYHRKIMYAFTSMRLKSDV